MSRVQTGQGQVSIARINSFHKQYKESSFFFGSTIYIEKGKFWTHFSNNKIVEIEQK